MFTGDISNMYLESTLDEPEYVKFRVDLIPPNIMENLRNVELCIDFHFVK